MPEYLKFLADAAAGAQARAAALQMDGRADEASFEKIRHNVFELCKTIYEALQRNIAPEQHAQRYGRKLRELRVSWQRACDKAGAHDDTQKQMIEEIKLNTLGEVQQAYAAYRRDTYAGN